MGVEISQTLFGQFLDGGIVMLGMWLSQAWCYSHYLYCMTFDVVQEIDKFDVVVVVVLCGGCDWRMRGNLVMVPSHAHSCARFCIT